MQLTPNYKLKKPEGTDPVDIQDFNDNADLIDAALKKKAESSGGDISEMTVKTLDTITTEFPVPVAGESQKSFLGKVKKFFEDTKNWMTGVCLIGQIVNNCVTNNAKLPLSAAQGKVLMDLYTVLNNDLTKKYGRMRQLTSSDNLDNITDNGIYWYPTESVPQNAPYQNAAVVEVIGSPSATGEKFQRVTRYGVPGKSSWRPLGGGSNGWLAWAEAFTDVNCQGGAVSITPTAINKSAYRTVTFPTAFTSNPSVVATPISSGPNVVSASVSDITPTSCKIYISRSDAAQATSVSWVAIMR